MASNRYKRVSLQQKSEMEDGPREDMKKSEHKPDVY